jgi:succinyl-diaminopimelate desuccinylase
VPDSPTLRLTRELIARRSLTPDDAGCCALFEQALAPLGFHFEYLNTEGVTNLWATWGESGPLIILAGHTDVVPTGPLSQWQSDPFTPTERDGLLYGRGAADMKSGLAAMVTAVQRLFARRSPRARLAFLITSDEEGLAQFGTRHVVAQLAARGIRPDYAIVGEASSNLQLGDRIVIGRRGSLNGRLKIFGKQGHVAYPHKTENPLHRALPALALLAAETWDAGNAHFPPTSFQISNLHAGTGANNMVPGECELLFNFRYSTESTAASLQERVHAALDAQRLRYSLHWQLSGEPFLTAQGALISAAREAIRDTTGLNPELFTGGGTSDARFLAPWGAQTVEIGPVNDSIHKLDEHVRVADLEPLSRIYEGILERLSA